ncbi:MAG: glycosyltransferase family 2 protein [Nitrospirae bacterium]|nr:glycosyltransferase family 2 protein [Nitrospirota bacterium]
MKPPAISIIIVNWNGKEFLEDCFNALQRQSHKDFEVIFVDNASTDASLKLAKELAADLKLNAKFVINKENRGFAGGNNEGFKHSSGEYIALLNTDTVADENWLRELTGAMSDDATIGLCASKLVVFNENVIDSAGDGYSTFGHAFKRGEGLSDTAYPEKEYVFGACAGAALYRREMIERIGFFDEDFFLIFEDTDISFRALLSGWKCLYVPQAVVSHRVGGSIRTISESAAYHVVRNDKLVKIKNIPFRVLMYKAPCLILGEIIWLIYYIIQKRFGCYVRGNIDALKMLPLMLKKRRQIMGLRKASNGYIISLLTSGFRLYGPARIQRYLKLHN